MIYNKILDSNLDISFLTLGTWVFAGDAWSGSKKEESLNAVAAALDHGINIIDTAPIYGYGLSEEIVGEAVRLKRDDVVIATKCGLIGKGKNITVDLSRESIFKEIDDSLRRLKTDYIDIYHCHWPDPRTSLEETMDALTQLKDQGKIRHIGVSNFNQALIREASRYAQIATVQDQYSLLAKEVEKEVLPACRNIKAGFLAYGPLAGGILTGKYSRPKDFPKGDARSFFYKYYKGPSFDKVKILLSQLAKFERPLNQLALNWLRQQEGVTSVIVGCRNKEQTISNINAASWDLNQEDILQINDIMKLAGINCRADT